MTRRGAIAAVALLAGFIGWGEFANWRSSWRLLGATRADPDADTCAGPGTSPGTDAVLVLGFRNANSERANAMNRWRVRAGLRSIDPNAQRGYAGEIVREDRSRSTWENLAYAIPPITASASGCR